MPSRRLPARPDLRQLKRQAKDLLRAFRRGDPSAIADFTDYHPRGVEPATARLADAQLVLARSHAADSWPRLVVVCRLIDALVHEHFDALQELAARHPEVLVERNDRSGVVRLIGDTANAGIRRVIETLQTEGVRNVTAAMSRPALCRWVDTLRLLGRLGGRPGILADTASQICVDLFLT